VHAKNLTCSNCHSVHAEKAKVLSFDHKEKIKMCVDCHKDFNDKREEQER
jgi:cytochrome c-type protein NrfB